MAIQSYSGIAFVVDNILLLRYSVTPLWRALSLYLALYLDLADAKFVVMYDGIIHIPRGQTDGTWTTLTVDASDHNGTVTPPMC